MTPEERRREADILSLDNIRVHRDNANSTVKNVNHIIFVLSAGIFTVSINFIGQLKTLPKYPWLLISSWVFLFLTICANVTVQYLDVKRSEKMIAELNAHRQSNFSLAWNMAESRDPVVRAILPWLKKLTYAVFTFLFLGFVSLILFGAINLLSQGQI